MLGRYPQAEKFVTDLLRELCPSAEIEASYNSSEDRFIYWLRFEDRQSRHTILFGRDLLDDFNNALAKGDTSTYGEVLKSAIHFTAYISLGKAGRMQRDFQISDVFVKERGDWNPDLKVTTNFDDRLTRQLVEGLEKLRRFLERHLAKNQDLGEGLEPLRSANTRIVGLLGHYKENKHLNAQGVSTDTLSFFKAAVVAQIIEQEIRRVKQQLAQVRAAIDLEIYGLVEKLRNTFFLHVPLPNWFAEYRELAMATQQGGQPINAGGDREIDGIHIFLSHKHDDVAIADAIKQCLQGFSVEAFVAHRDITPSAIWRRTILEHLQGKCNVFAPILTNAFRDSLWTDQETGIAVQSGLPVIPIKLERDPYGFIDDRQAVSLKPGEYLKMCLGLLVGLGTQHSLFGRVVRLCLAKGLGSAQSYAEAGMIAETLARLEPFSAEEATAVLRAVIANRQVYESFAAEKHVRAFLDKYRGSVDKSLVDQCLSLLPKQETGSEKLPAQSVERSGSP